MARILAPLWLASSSRFAGMARARAMWVAAALAMALAIGFSALAVPDPADTTAIPATSGVSLYDGVVGGLRAGGDYYDLTAQALRAGGYPLKPFVMFRLPTHAVVQAALPPIVSIVLLDLLTIGVACAWGVRLRPVLVRRPARIAATILLAIGLVSFAQPAAVAAHEVWAALLVALALAIRTSARWATSGAIGLIATLVCEPAILLPLTMAAFAWREGARRELGGWALALLAFALVLVAHAWGVSRVVGPLDASAPGWTWPGGFGLSVRAFVSATALQVVPLILAAPLAVLALFGWAAWRDPLAERMLVLLIAYAAAIAFVAQGDTGYWALIAAPVLLVGLVFAPDGVRDVGAALLDRRRVRVQRITR